MSHRGGILCLPDGVHAAIAATAQALMREALDRLTSQPLETQTVLLVGTGTRQDFADPDIRAAFAAAGIGLETMDTGAACRTYNILLAERRPVAAALLAVPSR
jgi:uncharacterized protein